MVGRAGAAGEEDPSKRVGGRRVEGAAWGEHSEGDHLEEEEVHREGNEEGTSPPGAEGPTWASWGGHPVPWEGRSQEAGVHKVLFEERDHPWGPWGPCGLDGVGLPSLDLLQGESFDHPEQAGDTCYKR